MEKKTDLEKIRSYRETVVKSLVNIGGVTINTSLEQSYVGILSVTVEGVEGDILFTLMPEFALSMSSACTATADKPSHVLTALGLNAKQAACTLRISFGCFTTEDDVKKLVNSLVSNISLMKNIQNNL